MKLVQTILNQNYFQHDNQTFKQQDGLVIGAPISAILSEIFLQYLENNNIIKTHQKHKIVDYHRYVDDILIVYNEKNTNINDTLTDLNKIHTNIQYIIETQINNKLNYLDITIENMNNTLTFDIYKKTTATDLIIHNNSCHPTEHKHAAIRYMTNKLNKYPISTNNKHKETQLINIILHTNGYPPQTLIHIPNTNKISNTTQKQKWATCTYVGSRTRTITRLFRNTDIRIAYRTNNNIQNYLQIKDQNPDK
jgi:hypothetical protein